jgi:hypothetical protein
MRAARGLLAVVLALAWVLAAALPATAASSTLVAPGAGAVISSAAPFAIRADATAGAFETVDGVEVRLASLPNTRAMDHTGGDRRGTSSWSATLNPMNAWASPGGGPLPNGSYTLEVRVRYLVAGAPRPPTDWRGHAIVLDVPPPATTVTASVVEVTARTVSVSWQPVSLPDFQRYVVQRAAGTGSYTDIAEVTSAGTTRFLDAAPSHGEWRYRVVVARASASGGSKTATSEPATVSFAPPPPPPAPIPTPTEPEPGQPDPTEPGTPDPTEPGEPGEPGDSEPPVDPPGGTENPDAPPAGDGQDGTAGGGGAPSSNGPVPGTPAARSAIPSIVTAPEPQPRRAPAVAAPGDTTFEEFLDFDLEQEITERHVVVEPDEPVRTQTGTLAIFERELDQERVLVPIAGGLLLMVTAGHLLRLSR